MCDSQPAQGGVVSSDTCLINQRLLHLGRLLVRAADEAHVLCGQQARGRIGLPVDVSGEHLIVPLGLSAEREPNSVRYSVG